MKIQQEQYQAICQYYAEHIQERTNDLNSFWNSLHKLVISCASGILFGSIAFVSFPFFKENYDIAFTWLSISWFCLLASIIMLIIGTIEQAKFFALYNLRMMRELNIINEAIQAKKEFVDMKDTPSLVFANIIPSVAGFILFLLGTVFLAGALLNTILPTWTNTAYIGSGLICLLIIWVVYALYQFYKAQKN